MLESKKERGQIQGIKPCRNQVDTNISFFIIGLCIPQQILNLDGLIDSHCQEY